MTSLSKAKVYFFYQHRGFSLLNRSRLKLFIENIFKKEKTTLHKINYIFCSDKQLLEINRQYLNHDFLTDIISFDLSDVGSGKVAEIYISIDRVRDNAKIFRVSFKEELHRVVFHGVLHLCGYGDKKKDEIKQMRAKEQFYLERYFIS